MIGDGAASSTKPAAPIPQGRDEQADSFASGQGCELLGDPPGDHARLRADEAIGTRGEGLELPLSLRDANAIVGAHVATKPVWRADLLDGMDKQQGSAKPSRQVGRGFRFTTG